MDTSVRAVDTTGYLSLAEAAAIIGRSGARVRQYWKDGKLGEDWKRNEMGHIYIAEAGVAAFTPPERGDTRAAGVNPNTHLRHVKAAAKLVKSRIADGEAKTATLQVLAVLIQAIGVEAEEADADPDAVEDDQTVETDNLVIENVAPPVAANDPEVAVPTEEAFDSLLKSI